MKEKSLDHGFRCAADLVAEAQYTRLVQCHNVSSIPLSSAHQSFDVPAASARSQSVLLIFDRGRFSRTGRSHSLRRVSCSCPASTLLMWCFAERTEPFFARPLAHNVSLRARLLVSKTSQVLQMLAAENAQGHFPASLCLYAFALQLVAVLM